MKKLFGLMILTLYLSLGCGGGIRPPVPPTPPPPQEFCGDRICSGTEHWTNCPQDCPQPPPPVCDLDGKCERPKETPSNCKDCELPEPDKCDPEKYQFEGCPKITRDHTTIRMAGVYVGIMGDPTFNYSRLFKLFKVLNYINIHGDSLWEHNGTLIFEFDPVKKVYNPKKLDPVYEKRLENLFAAAQYYGIGIEWTFQSEYCNTHYKGPYQAPYSPWRDTNVVINWGGQTLTKNNGGLCGNKGQQSPLYRNWNRRLPLQPNVAFMHWTDETNSDTFKAANDLGQGWMNYIDLVARVAKKYPNLKILFRPANEPWRVTEPCDSNDSQWKCLDDARGNPLDDRTFNYIFDRLTKLGLRNGGNYQYVVEETFRNGGGPVNMYFSDKTYNRYIVPRRYRYEFHGVEKVKQGDWKNAKGEDIEFFTKSLKMDPKRLVLSNDGDKGERDFPKEYYKRLKTIYQWQKQNPGSAFDYKVASEPVDECVWKTKKIQENLDCRIPAMEREIFQ